MGKCEYVDDNANFLDGWHCTIIKGRVDDPDIVGYYCKSVTACEYCPYRGGDDRYRKQKNEPERSERTYESERRDPEEKSGDSSDKEQKGSSGDKHGYAKSKKIWGVSILLIVLLFLIIFVAAKLGVFRSTVNLYLDIPDGVDHRDISMIAVSLDPEHLYETSEKKFSEDGNCSLKIRDGRNEIYLSYNGVCILLGDAIGDSSNHFQRDDFSYEDMQSFLFRTIMIDLQNTDGLPIENAVLQVENKSGDGEEPSLLQLDADTYVIIMSNTYTAPILSVKAEGYESLDITVDLTEERVEKMLLTLSSVEGDD